MIYPKVSVMNFTDANIVYIPLPIEGFVDLDPSVYSTWQHVCTEPFPIYNQSQDQ